ncbi:very short patch repair endonuclease [Actinophytocola sp. NPDC049390]|uniref:very short patch repair endonuclease n=1 Tax=Actinophytocola sp. NPDC049390 TaxID=3363894 RepID=UPI0037AB4283
MGSIKESKSRQPSWASSPATRRSMQANRSRDTKPEVALRQLLHARGLRYRVCARPIPGMRRTADIVFRPARVAVEVYGCFWHGCPEHYRAPATNSQYWAGKVERNMRRDADTANTLNDAGWALVVVWEHENLTEAAERVTELVMLRRAALTQSRTAGRRV